VLPALDRERDSSPTMNPSLGSKLRSGGGKRIGDGALDGLAEWMLRVRRGPRNGLVEGVKANSEEVVVLTAEEYWGGEYSTKWPWEDELPWRWNMRLGD